MRLIDADQITDKEISQYLGVEYASCTEDIRSLIDEQPTAYDVDKVVEQLETEMKKTKEKINHGRGLLIKEPFTPYIKAIEIVKGGGVDAIN